MTEALIELNSVDVALDGTTVLRDINWQLHAGEQWALLGGNGSGKSTFLRLVRGDVWPAPGKGERIYRIGSIERTTAVAARKWISLVSPELQDRYLQQEWRLTGLQVLYSGFANADFPFIKPSPKQKRFAEELSHLLRIRHLLRRNVQQLSTGELRKVLIARALAGRPAIIALDEVSDGLDAPSRQDLLEMLNGLLPTGTQLIFATHRREEIFPAITHVLELANGRVDKRRPSADVFPMNCPFAPALCPSGGDGELANSFRGSMREGSNGRNLTRSMGQSSLASDTTLRACDARVPAGEDTRAPCRVGATLLRIEQADVFVERKRVLQNINWEIRRGEHWVVLGSNGAGKSTLLKLAFGDLQPAWGGKISRFNFTAGSALWRIRKKIGYSSPELLAGYRRVITGANVIASGFYSSVGLHQPLSRSQKQRVKELIDVFGAAELARKTADQMSYGELAKILLLRALVHGPEILICDEPFSGLDAATRQELSTALGSTARGGTSLVLATHYLGDLPDCMTHGLLLQSGHIVMQGYLEEVRADPTTERLFRAL